MTTTPTAAGDTESTGGVAPRQIANVVAVAGVIAMNALANVIPLGGNTTGELSDAYPSLVTPAGYVFSIWGFIYALLVVFAAYQVRPSQRDNPRLQRLGWWFVANAVLNVAWLFAWHYEFVLVSLGVMVALLASLVVIYGRLRIPDEPVGRAEQLAVRLPFSVYLGWIVIATVANVTVALIDAGVEAGDLTEAVAIAVLAVAAGIGVWALRALGDLAIGAVVVWALVGVAVARWLGEPVVAGAALIAATVVTVVAAATAWQRAVRT